MLRSSVILFIASAVFAADVRVIEEIAVKVNGDIITRGDLADKQRQLAQAIQQEKHLSGAALQQAVNEQSKDMLEHMIDERLLVQKAKELDLKVDPDVNRRLSELQVMSGFADPDKFHDWIREQTGVPFEDYKQQLTDGYLTQRLIGSEIQSHISVPEPEMQKYYDQHKGDFTRKDEVFLSQIVILTEGKTPEQVAQAEKKAQDLAARARKGEKFSELARANSDDAETAREGGQLPPRQRGISRPEIESKIFGASKGTVLDPINVPGYGFVILRIDDRYEAGQESFDEAKDEIQSILARPKMEPKVREYLTKLRQQAFLEIKDGYVDSGAAPGKDTRWHEVVGLKPETTTKEEVAAHRHRAKFLGIIPHGSVAPGTKETSGSAVPVETATAAESTPAASTGNTATPAPAAGTPAAPATAASAPAASEPGVVSKPRKILGVIPHGTEQATAKPPKPEKPKAPPQPIKQ
ncbi:MAG: peptidyl-prolyl cis-trans isomerase [Bryobacteraceae bacterium]